MTIRIIKGMVPLRELIRSITVALLLCYGSIASGDTEIQRLIDNGNLAEALSSVKEKRSSSGDSPELRFLEATILEKNGDYQEAILIYEALIVSHPQMPEPYNNLAIHHADKGEFEVAIDLLERSIQTHPSYATSYGNLVSIYDHLASRAYKVALNSDAEIGDPTLTNMGSIQSSIMESQVEQVATIETSTSPSPTESTLAAGTSTESAPVDEATTTSPSDSIELASNTTGNNGNEGVAPAENPATENQVTDNQVEETQADQNQVVEEVSAVIVSEIDTGSQQPTTSTSDIDEVDSSVTTAESTTPEVATTESPETPNATTPSAQEAGSNPVDLEDNLRLQTQKNTVIDRMKSWAQAWSDQSVDAYLSHYSKSFKPREDLSFAQWQDKRRTRIVLRDFIEVDIYNFSVEIEGGIATVNFTQRYRSNVFEDTIRKTVELQLEGDRWLIISEIV